MSDLCLLATMVAKMQLAEQPRTEPEPAVDTTPSPRQRSLTPKALISKVSPALSRPQGLPKSSESRGSSAEFSGQLNSQLNSKLGGDRCQRPPALTDKPLTDTLTNLRPQDVLSDFPIANPNWKQRVRLVAYNQPSTQQQLRPRSGGQMYFQRLAALKAGKLYTRLPMDSFHGSWSQVRQHPNYTQWKRLLALEARATGRGQGLNRLSIVVGDSLSQWLPMQSLPNSQLWLNQGISGDTTQGILQRLSYFKETRPESIYVLAGINDLRRGATDDEVLGNLREIMVRLRQQHPRSQIFVQSLLPNAIGIPNSRIRSLNQQIAEMTREESVSYLDLYSQFSEEDGSLVADFTTDGLHLNDRGYAVWQSVLRDMQAWVAYNGAGIRAAMVSPKAG